MTTQRQSTIPALPLLVAILAATLATACGENSIRPVDSSSRGGNQALMAPEIKESQPPSPANQNTPLIAGEAVPGSRVFISSDPGCRRREGTGAANSLGIFMVAVTVPDNSTTTFYAQSEKDGVRSGCSPLTLTYVEDSTPPPAPMILGSLPESPSRSANTSLLGIAEPDTTLLVFVGNACDQPVVDGQVEGDGRFTVALTVAEDSRTIFSAQSRDHAGNLSPCLTAGFTYVEDSTPPLVPAALSLTPVGPSDNARPRLAGLTERGARVGVFADAACSTALAMGVSDDDGRFDIEVPVAENATTTIYANAADAVGNVSSCTAQALVYVEDSLPPLAPILEAVNPQGPANFNAPVIAGRAEARAAIRIFSDSECRNTVAQTLANEFGRFSTSVTVADDSDSTFFAQAYDGVHFSACSSTSARFVEDSTPPRDPTIDELLPRGPANHNRPIVSGTGEGDTLVEFHADAACSNQIAEIRLGADGIYSVPVAVVDDSTTAFYLRARDSAGNASDCRAAGWTYVEDSTPPAEPRLIASHPESPSDDASPDLSGEGEPGSRVTVFGDATCDRPLAALTVPMDGRFRAAGVAVEPESEVAFHIRAADVASNQTPCKPTGLVYASYRTSEGTALLLGSNTTAAFDAENVNQAGNPALIWSTAVVHSQFFAHPRSTPAHRLRVQVGGDYRVNFTAGLTSAGTRTAVIARVRVNGVARPGAMAASGYVSGADGHGESSLHLSTLLSDLKTDDEIDVIFEPDAATGRVTISETARLHVEYVDPSREVFLATATESMAPRGPTDLNQRTPHGLRWTSSIVGPAFAHEPRSPEIRLLSPGAHRVSVTVPLTGTSQRTNVRVEVLLNNKVVAGGRAQQGYIRGQNGHDRASVHWSGIIPHSVPGDILSVTVARVAATGVVTTPVGDPATLFVERLASVAGVISLRSTTLVGGSNWNEDAAWPLAWTAQEILDPATYGHALGAANPNVRVLKAGDYELHYNGAVTSKDGATNPRVRVLVNGAPVSGCETKTHFIEAQATHIQASGGLSVLLRNLQKDDVISLTTEREAAAGTVEAETDARLWIHHRPPREL